MYSESIRQSKFARNKRGGLAYCGLDGESVFAIQLIKPSGCRVDVLTGTQDVQI